MEENERPSLTIIVCTLILATCPASLAKIIYVDDDANGQGNGSSWQNAFKYLQDALTSAKSAEKPVEVWVAQGVYKPDRSAANPGGSRSRDATFHLIDQVTLRGGFAGVGMPDPNIRDIGAYKSILSGDLAGNDVELADLLAARDEPTRSDNCIHVVSYNESGWLQGDLTAELDGFIITGGYAFVRKMDGPEEFPQPVHFGGAMYVYVSSKSVGTVTVRGCTFERNYAEIANGGASLSYIDHLTLERCTFSENVGYRGTGGLSCGGGDTTLSNCTFERNQTTGDGGGLALGAGNALLTDCSFSQNTADSGGGLYSGATATKLVNCVLSQNVASGSGGAILLSDGALGTWGCKFVGNQAAYGGAILVSSSSDFTTLSNSVFAGNSAYKTGGVIWMRMSEVRLLNCTVSGNRASHGRFLLAATPADTGMYPRGSVDIINCIVSDGGDEIWNDHGAVTVRYTDSSGGQTAVHDPNAMITWGQGNIETDPCFASPGYWDPNGTADDPADDVWMDGDYHLKSQGGRWNPVTKAWVMDNITSPCIDAGDPNLAIGSEPFPSGGRINLGAYGGTAEASKSYFGGPVCETIVAGDINGDCRVDFADLDILAQHWLKEGGSSGMNRPLEK
ncbi:MAG: right-handed parallel beta-helix repeat-containing protein [Sedimentisphaerales bacterium]|nr:right-handed parallel beta-helix repeat-containing protein [Sedimentisphaerales bacterium]